MKSFLKFISFYTLLCISGIYLPIYSAESKSFIFDDINFKNSLVASKNNVKTVFFSMFVKVSGFQVMSKKTSRKPSFGRSLGAPWELCSTDRADGS